MWASPLDLNFSHKETSRSRNVVLQLPHSRIIRHRLIINQGEVIISTEGSLCGAFEASCRTGDWAGSALCVDLGEPEILCEKEVSSREIPSFSQEVGAQPGTWFVVALNNMPGGCCRSAVHLACKSWS